MSRPPQSGGSQVRQKPFFRVPGPPGPSPAVGAAFLGLNPLWGSLTPTYPPWVNNSLYGLPWYPQGYPAAYPIYGGDFGAGLYGPGYYPPQPPANVTVVFPPQPSPVIVPQPIPVPEIASDAELAQPQAAAIPAAPPREPVVQDEYPALIVVKNGNLYSSYQYWQKGKTFHFITTNGERHQIPVSMLEQLYPPRKNGHPVEPKAPAQR